MLRVKKSKDTPTEKGKELYSAEEMKRIEEALEREGLTDMCKEFLKLPWVRLDVMYFVENSERCARCIPKDCSFNGYQTTLRVDGSIALIPCARYKKYKAKCAGLLLNEKAEIPEGYKKMTFETLDPKGNEGTISYGKDIAQGASLKGLYLFGSTGCGKTHLAIATLQKWTNDGRGSGLFTTTPALLSTLKGAFKDAENTEHIRKKLMSVDLLVLDDIGTEAWSEWVSMIMFELINDRYINRKKTIFTSNLSQHELELRMGINGKKIISRINDMCYARKMIGKDRRINGQV